MAVTTAVTMASRSRCMKVAENMEAAPAGRGSIRGAAAGLCGSGSDLHARTNALHAVPHDAIAFLDAARNDGGFGGRSPEPDATPLHFLLRADHVDKVAALIREDGLARECQLPDRLRPLEEHGDEITVPELAQAELAIAP